MVEWVLGKKLGPPAASLFRPTPGKRDWLFVLSLPVAFTALAMADTALFNLIVDVLADAYLAVSVFVALTLGGFYWLNRVLDADIVQKLNSRSIWQVPCAALLGGLPGCGGAIIVVTQYVNGSMSFGALVAVLISTMGDAAFLLLAREPETALLVYGLSCIAGVVAGWLINAIHGADFLKPSTKKTLEPTPSIPRLSKQFVTLFTILLAPGVVFGVMSAFTLDPNLLFGSLASLDPVRWWGFAGAVVCAAIWIGQPVSSWSVRFGQHAPCESIRETMAAETSFVTTW
ncbi:MAG: putative manganese transporter, partial [Pseudomonadota bacterium]